MDIYCTRPSCPDPINSFSALDNGVTFKAVQQRYCAACTMPLILDNRYLPLKRLGRGAFGMTFLALDLRSAKRRQCIVKQLQPTGELTPSQLEAVKRAFRREAETLETLGDEHYQIPSLYAYFELTTPVFLGMKSPEPMSSYSEEYFYLVQERVDGQDLTKEINQKGAFSEAEVLEVMRQILPVLQFIHEHDVIHRDIKPSNIMRDHNNRIVLIDFGAVKQVTTGMPMQHSIVFGTLGFAPPEQVAGRQVFPASDLYSLAVTLLCLLTARDPQELFQPYGNPLGWRSQVEVSDRLGQILDRMLQPMPKQRYQTAIEVMADLFPELIPYPGQSMLQAEHPAALRNGQLHSLDVLGHDDDPDYETMPFADDNAATQAQSVASTQSAPPPNPGSTPHPKATVAKPETPADGNGTIAKPAANASQPPKSIAPPTVAQPPTPPTTVQPLVQPIDRSPPSTPPPQVSVPQPGLTAEFLARCREALAYYIGPIAGFVVEETLDQGNYSSQHQFAETLAQEIPDPQEAQAFMRRLF